MLRTIAFIENDMYVRNFVTSGAFDLLKKGGSFRVCTSEIVEKLRHAVPPEIFLAPYQRQLANRPVIHQFNKVSMMAYRDRSTTFDIKVGVSAFGAYTLDELIMASVKDFNVVKELFLRRMQNNASLQAIVETYRPELVIFPYTGVESTSTELVLLSRRYGFHTLFLVNGWDNLCSKGVLPVPPDFLGVWGPQSLLDAVNVQGMKHHQCFLLGCARYEDYFRPENAQTNPFPFPYILFAGATTACDELTPLRLLEEAMEEEQVNEVKVVYRPHPWREKRKCFDTFEPENFKHVVLDPQVEEAYFSEKSKGTESVSSQNFPELTYYPSLVNHAQFVVSPMSSMTLEAGLFDVPALILAHDDGCHAIPPSAQLRYKHFEGAEELPGWFVVKDLPDLKPRFKVLLQRFKEDNPSRRLFRPGLSQALRKYLFVDERAYAQRLSDAVQVIESLRRQRTLFP